MKDWCSWPDDGRESAAARSLPVEHGKKKAEPDEGSAFLNEEVWLALLHDPQAGSKDNLVKGLLQLFALEVDHRR